MNPFIAPEKAEKYLADSLQQQARRNRSAYFVLAGLGRLGPAIHALVRRNKDVDTRDEPAQDD